MGPAPADRPPRSLALDGVRGLAIAAVVAYHAFCLAGGSAAAAGGHLSPLWWPVGTGRYGVDALFVVSGFLVVASWEAARRNTTRPQALRRFFARRAARILPAYWLSLLVLVPLLAPALLDNVRQLLLFATVNQYVDAGLPSKVNVVYWSLTTEWHFYLLVPVVAWLLRRLGGPRLLALCLAVSVGWWMHQPFGLPPSSIFGRLDQFVAGALAAQVVARWRAGGASRLVDAVRRPLVAVGLVAVVVALGTYEGSTLGIHRGMWLDPFVHPVVGLALAAGLIRVLTTAPSTALGRPMLRAVGASSYSLYLWHYPILRFGLRWFGVASLPVLLAASMLVAVGSRTFVEEPFLRRRAATRAVPVTIGSVPRNRAGTRRDKNPEDQVVGATGGSALRWSRHGRGLRRDRRRIRAGPAAAGAGPSTGRAAPPAR